jgi:hypothetical protein
VSGTPKKAPAHAEAGYNPSVVHDTKQREKLSEVRRLSSPYSAFSSLVQGDIAGDIELQEEPHCDNIDSIHATEHIAASDLENTVAAGPSNSSLVPGLDSTLRHCAMPQPITTNHTSLTTDKLLVLESDNTLVNIAIACSSEAQRSVDILQKF